MLKVTAQPVAGSSKLQIAVPGAAPWTTLTVPVGSGAPGVPVTVTSKLTCWPICTGLAGLIDSAAVVLPCSTVCANAAELLGACSPSPA